ncbi:kinesin family protein [Skeletonema marinoi]|uniref:Kinesin-like protein n=1 Tax=Skeletonema marinoi TaxID=267567 RepID=A0AAD8YMT7_9STRA|nr:kinesin family protein [Skeletonema marinoi]
MVSATTDTEAASDSAIDVFLRIRPSKNPSYFERDEVDDNRIRFKVPVDQSTVNNTRSHYGYEFNGVLDEKASQKDVFQTVGIPVTKNVLDGYNSTIFAYGQTGSGKTFTITGGPSRYEDRGIIPRVISNLFRTMNDAAQNGASYSCYVSYLEIYNSSGYDLLVKDHGNNGQIPKVTMLEDEYGAFHFKGLSMHMVSSEEEALDLLFIGDTNRAIAATEMNQNSTRSHCIFTIMLEKRQVGCDTVTRSKLNIVDLAGSERVSRTNSAGSILTEAKYINSSLFFLEMVIVALYEKEKKGKNVHIPYRNSMMTSVLRDSLGGNCKTIMIATISPESQHTDESISTCNFAQRVKCVKNKASVNEEIEPELVIERLKAEVRRLKEEVEFLSDKKDDDGECSNELSEEDIGELTKSIETYVQDRDEHCHLDFCGGVTIPKIHAVCSIFKDKLLIAQQNEGSCNNNTLNVSHEPHTPNIGESDENDVTQTTVAADSDVANNDTTNVSRNRNRGGRRPKPKHSAEVCGVPLCSDTQILDEPANAFAWFKERYPGLTAIESSKSELKTKYTEAKSTGAKIEEHKRKVSYHKSMISEEGDPSLVKFHSDAAETEKRVYKDALGKLRELKATIEGTQKVIVSHPLYCPSYCIAHYSQYFSFQEAGRLKLQKDFDKWYSSSQRSSPDQTESSHEDEDLATPKQPVSNIPVPTKRHTLSNTSISESPPPPQQEEQPPRVVDNSPAEFKLPPGIKLTGNKEADDDIIAFFKAKELLLSRASSMRR